MGIEFPFDEESFWKPGNTRVRLTQAERRSQQWTRQLNSSQATEEEYQQKGQEHQDITEMWLKEPESNQMEMSHMTVRLETMTAEGKQHALELETMRLKYEAWMKRTEDLTYENELLKRVIRKHC